MENYGRYILLRKLAVGGMAEVFLACPQGARARDERIVIKRILSNLAADDHFVTMFLNEARIAARLSHPNIVRLFDLGKEGQSYFLAMEFIHGEDLGALIARLNAQGRHLPLPLALRIVREACRGLHYAHTKLDEHGRPLQLIHRDVSPQNIMVSFEGEVKLLDFGIARAANQSSTTRTGEIKGKYAYIAPEQARGTALDQRCDIFSLGLVLYELLTGHSPLRRGNDLITLRAAIECDIAPPSRFAALPAALEAIVLKALARDPARRFASAIDFERAIERFLPDPDPEATRRALAAALCRLFAERLRGASDRPLSVPGRSPPHVRAIMPAPTSDTLVSQPAIGALALSGKAAVCPGFDAFDGLEGRDVSLFQGEESGVDLEDDGEASTVTRRMAPPVGGGSDVSASLGGTLEERLDVQGIAARAMGNVPRAGAARRAGGAAPARPDGRRPASTLHQMSDDDEETTVTREVLSGPPCALGSALPKGGSDAFPRPREGQGTTQQEALSDEMSHSRRHASQEPRAWMPRPQRSPAPPMRKRRYELRHRENPSNGRDGGKGPPEANTAELAEEETVVDEGLRLARFHERGGLIQAQVCPASEKSGPAPPGIGPSPEPADSLPDDDEETTSAEVLRHRSDARGLGRALPAPQQMRARAQVEHDEGASSPPPAAASGERQGVRCKEQDLFDEATTASSANRIRSARRALEQQVEHAGSNAPIREEVALRASRRPRPLMSAEVELIGEPVTANGTARRARGDAQLVRGASIQGSLAERLEMAGAPKKPSLFGSVSESEDDRAPKARLPALQARIGVQRAIQRFSIIADWFDEIRLRFGIPWSAIAAGLCLLLVLLVLTLALLAGD